MKTVKKSIKTPEASKPKAGAALLSKIKNGMQSEAKLRLSIDLKAKRDAYAQSTRNLHTSQKKKNSVSRLMNFPSIS